MFAEYNIPYKYMYFPSLNMNLYKEKIFNGKLVAALLMQIERKNAIGGSMSIKQKLLS